MHRMFLSVLTGLCALCLYAQKDDRTLRPQQATALPPAQEARMALVIGNGAYRDAPLRNPVNDARAMKLALENCQFEVTLKLNATKQEMEEAIRVFGDRIQGGAVGLAFGFHDMIGNVEEWCQDWFHPYESGRLWGLSPRPLTDPTGPPSGTARVLRGGGPPRDVGSARSAYRSGSLRTTLRPRSAFVWWQFPKTVANRTLFPALKQFAPPGA